MAYVLRSYRRVPVHSSVTYEQLLREGTGTVWNVSLKGWRLSGTLALQVGEVCSLRVRLPTNKHISVAAGIVRWVRGQEYGIENLVLEENARARLDAYIRERVAALYISYT